MLAEKEVALIGTGLAPLVAAAQLISHGRKPLVLNPDWDFFREDSELPLDPFWPRHKKTSVMRDIKKSGSESVLGDLRPDFPGAVEYWDEQNQPKKNVSFHDESAPHVRARSRLWVSSSVSVASQDPRSTWSELESLFVEASDAGLNPQELDGLSAAKRFPGFSNEPKSEIKGIMIPKLSDWDVNRYRYGLYEYIKERLGADGLVTSANQIQFIPGGVRFYSQGKLRTEKIQNGLIVFWTPTLTPWLESNFKIDRKPRGIRIWEEWSLISREHVDKNTVGVFEDMHVWTSFEGRPKGDRDPLQYLTVLRPGHLIPLEEYHPLGIGQNWLSGKSFEDISRLCHDFLNWEKLTIRKVRPRAIFDWGEENQWPTGMLTKERKLRTKFIIPSDGPMNQVVRAARNAIGDLI